ncbi:MAG: four helix bundle protein [Chloroflexi bacterium]|nr:four helix bundle protein [Chloroflexota bacterium]
MTPEELRSRTKRSAVDLIRFCGSLPETDESRIIRRQIVRAGTAVGANYRAVCRSRSARDFIAKIGIVIEEVDETLYWLEVLVEAQIVASDAGIELRGEAEELTRIFVASRVTARRNANASRTSA